MTSTASITDSNCTQDEWFISAASACHRIPPLWPLKHFVAVNPFVGFADLPFIKVCELIKKVTHGSMLMPPEYFRQESVRGRIYDHDLWKALQTSRKTLPPLWANEAAKLDVADLTQWLHYPTTIPHAPTVESRISSVTDIVDETMKTNWSQWTTDEISKWCAAYYDDGQSVWRMPWKKQSLFAAWKSAASLDATPEIQGLKGFRAAVAELPDDPAEAISCMMNQMGLPLELAENYFHRLLLSIHGWSAYVQQRVRENGLHGKPDYSLMDLLAVRLCYDLALLDLYKSPEVLRCLHQQHPTEDHVPNRDILILTLWHLAIEQSYQRELLDKITLSVIPRKAVGRPAVQAVFCIDVRSEIMRRSLESVSDEIETLGFAGFFGLPIEFIPWGHRHGTSQCPVLLTPKFRVREGLKDSSPEREEHLLRSRQLSKRLNHSWSAFKLSAVSCFSFVECAGLGFGWELLNASFQLRKKSETNHACKPVLTPKNQLSGASYVDQPGHLESGISMPDRVQLALGALKNMGLTNNFARLVLLCGHGSNTTNNPYASGLDCGACGGHAGDSNARVGAAILNQTEVRAALTEHGVVIPEDTYFIAGLHDTTTDRVTLFDTDDVPLSHKTDIAELQLWLAEAEMKTRKQRAAALGLNSDARIEKQVFERSRDWSQVRPEWGLAGNAALIVAPRERTRGLDLGGRVFLHNYCADMDNTNATLELIMTAPMVVANWINLQYYASTVNNALYGSGNKVLHNVVGTLGVLQGNGGDLQTGLPLQSLHDGEKWIHEPLKLSVIIEAPREKISLVVAKHESVRELVDNGWLSLFALEGDQAEVFRYLPGNHWEPS